ncbi:MFS transporter [Streptomyces sp. NPDC052051]|uniref:MFS transporter n=1 Tax=Streptomyces sp. NPDC052051 TaxID=3154649 RepID=UPI0034340FF4
MKTWRRTSSDGRALLLAVLVTGLTTFMFLPLLAIHFTAEGLPAGRVGFLVGLLAFCSQGFSLVCGLIVDRLGPRAVLISGFALRIVGYLLLALGDGGRLVPLVSGIAAIGVGGSLLGLTIKTLLVREDSVEPREMLALRSTFVNVGVVAGPALGAAVYPLGFSYILAACVLSHLLLGLRLTLRPAANDRSGQPTSTAAAKDAPPAAATPQWARWRWVPLCLLGVAFWAIYSQLNVLMPITAKELTGSTGASSVVFTLNGVLCVLLQYTLLHHVFGKATTRTLLAVGFVAFACAYAVFIPLAGWSSLFAFVLPVTVAEMLIAPSLDEQAVKVSSARRTGLALGTMSAAGAVGSLLGSSLGGYLLQTLHGDTGLWLVLVVFSLVAAATCFLLPKVHPQHA